MSLPHGNVKYYSHLGNQCTASTETKNMYLLQTRNPASRIYAIEIKAPAHKDMCPQVFAQHYF